MLTLAMKHLEEHVHNATIVDIIPKLNGELAPPVMVLVKDKFLCNFMSVKN